MQYCCSLYANFGLFLVVMTAKIVSKCIQWCRYCCEIHEVAWLALHFIFISNLLKHTSWQNIGWKRDKAAGWLFSSDYDSLLMLTVCSEWEEEYCPKDHKVKTDDQHQRNQVVKLLSTINTVFWHVLWGTRVLKYESYWSVSNRYTAISAGLVDLAIDFWVKA